jgi:hypothetical protein
MWSRWNTAFGSATRNRHRPDGLDAFELIRRRRACRSFQHRGLTDADRQEVLRSIRELTRPDRLIGPNPVRLEHLFAPTFVTWPTTGAREFIAAIAPHAYDRVSIVDVGRALEKAALDATRARSRRASASVRPREGPCDLYLRPGLPVAFKPLVVRIIAKIQSGRRPLAELFFADSRLQTPLAVDEAPFSRFEACYEAARWAPSAFNGQPTRCAAVTDEGGKCVERFDLCTATTSRYYAPVALGIWCGNWEVGCAALGIAGHFEALPAGLRGGTAATPDAPPLYHVSRVADSAP